MMRLTRCVVLLVVLSVAATSAWAGTVRHEVPDSQYTALAAQPQFDPVGAMLWTDSGGTFLCSGTLVTSQWVLTAAHCVDTAATSRTFTVGGSTYDAPIAIAHPSWTGDYAAGVDIGLVRLDSAVTNVSPAVIFSNPPNDFDGAIGTSVGFGRTGTGLTGATQPAGTKRAGRNVVDSSGLPGYAGNILFSDFDSPAQDVNTIVGVPWATPAPVDLEYLTAPGDSGGGLFFQATSGLWALGAVHSFGLSVDGNLDYGYGDVMGSTVISPFIPWINQTIAEVEASLAVPTPAAVAPGLALMALVAARRRGA